MCLGRNTQRGSTDALSLQGIVSSEVSYVSNDDRFAASTNPRPGVEGEVGLHTSLDAPGQFPNDLTPRHPTFRPCATRWSYFIMSLAPGQAERRMKNEK